MKKIFIVSLFACFAFSAQASDVTKVQKVNELLMVMDADNMIDEIYTQMFSMMQSMNKSLKLKDSEQAMNKMFSDKMADMLKKELSWAKMKPGMISIYVKHYTEKEIDDMISFYESESGQSMLKKMPAVMKDSMQIGQQMVMSIIPKMNAMREEFKNELKLARNETTSSKE